jgi:hypothetical protein
MSQNPYRELPTANPYATPSGYAMQGAPSNANPLVIPAVFLIILSTIYILPTFIILPMTIYTAVMLDESAPAGSSARMAAILAASITMLVTSVAIIIGSIGMLRMKGYRGALMAAIISSIPLFSPCALLGIPFGVWAIVLLSNPDVKNRFQ